MLLVWMSGNPDVQNPESGRSEVWFLDASHTTFANSEDHFITYVHPRPASSVVECSLHKNFVLKGTAVRISQRIFLFSRELFRTKND